MKKVFLDSDVVLDFLLGREPFFPEIAEIFDRALRGYFALSISPTSVTNLHYIIGRIENRKNATIKIKKLLKLVRVENVGQSAISKAIDSKFKDFEDSVQYYCALESDHQIIVTRNTKDFKESSIAIFNPKELLAKTEQ